MKQLGEQVISRRIDLRLDRPDPLVRALPHEMAHIVLADVVARQKLPRWVDEGIAMRCDPIDKQQAHYRDLNASFDRRTGFRLSEFLVRTDYPDASRQAAFYGQSLSLVEFLVERESPARFLKFAQAAAREGYDRALHEHYAIKNTFELERAWLAATVAEGKPPMLATRRINSKQVSIP